MNMVSEKTRFRDVEIHWEFNAGTDTLTIYENDRAIYSCVRGLVDPVCRMFAHADKCIEVGRYITLAELDDLEKKILAQRLEILTKLEELQRSVGVR